MHTYTESHCGQWGLLLGVDMIAAKSPKAHFFSRSSSHNMGQHSVSVQGQLKQKSNNWHQRALWESYPFSLVRTLKGEKLG